MTNDKFWEIFDYEWAQYLACRGLYRDFNSLFGSIPVERHQAIKNAIVESMLVHIRVLADIYLGDIKRTKRREHPNTGDIKLSEIQVSHLEGLAAFKTAYEDTIRANDFTIKEDLNKRLFHPDRIRSDGYLYKDLVDDMHIHLVHLVKEISTIRGPGQGPTGPSLDVQPLDMPAGGATGPLGDTNSPTGSDGILFGPTGPTGPTGGTGPSFDLTGPTGGTGPSFGAASTANPSLSKAVVIIKNPS